MDNASKHKTLTYGGSHELRTPNKAFFHWNPELLGLGSQIKQINPRAFGVFPAKISALIIQPLFLKKTKPL